MLVAWRLKDKRVLLIGGGEVASGRLESVLAADAFVTLISPHDGLHPRTKFLIENSSRITYYDRVFRGPEDLQGIQMVLSAIDDVEGSRQICTICREMKIPVNVADIPPSCDFYFGSQIRRGPLQVIVSTNGNSPKLASIIRKKIEESLPEKVEEAIEKVGLLRTKLRKRAPGVGGELSTRRMRWMASVCNKWDLQGLADLNEDTMEDLLNEGWEKGIVPSPEPAEGSLWKLPPELIPAAVGIAVGAIVTGAVILLRRR